jgi:hypothetical protein
MPAPSPVGGAPHHGPAAAPMSGDQVAAWFSKPANLKLVAGAIGGLVVLLMLVNGSPGVKAAAVLVGFGVWVVCFRQGYHQHAGLRLHTQLSSDEVCSLATTVAANLKGPLSSVAVNGTSQGRLHLIVRGMTWRPLDFHVGIATGPAGWTAVSSRIDHFTWSRYRIYLIPVPFTKGIQGYGLYKTYGDRLITALRERDPAVTGQYHNNPPQ